MLSPSFSGRRRRIHIKFGGIFTSHCEALHELERYSARAQCGRHAFIPRSKITMGSPFSIRPAVAPTKLEEQRNHQLEPLRGRAAQGARKNAARFKREIEFDRRRPANSLNKSSTQLWLTLDP